MTNDTLKTAEQEGIFTIIINRPASLNALNSQFFIDFNRLLDHIKNRLKNGRRNGKRQRQ